VAREPNRKACAARRVAGFRGPEPFAILTQPQATKAVALSPEARHYLNTLGVMY
jgi:hypothetical protein